MRKMQWLGLALAAAMLPTSQVLADPWVDLTVPATITQKDCEAGFRAPYQTFVTDAQRAAGMRPTRNAMSCWGLHVSRNEIFDACMGFSADVNQRCVFWDTSPRPLPLTVAVSHLNEHAMQVLLARGADAREGHLVHQLPFACATNADLFAVCKRMLGELVRHGAAINDPKRGEGLRDDDTPFLVAANSATRQQWLDALLELGADVNAKGPDRCTALDRVERNLGTALRQGGNEQQGKGNLPAFLKARGGKNSPMCGVMTGYR